MQEKRNSSHEPHTSSDDAVRGAALDIPYRAFGVVLTCLARKRAAQDHRTIAARIWKATCYEVTPYEIERYLHGASLPEQLFLPAFAVAFSLSEEECRTLSWVYCYGYSP